MKKQIILLLICCVVVTDVSNVLGGTSERDKSRLEKWRKAGKAGTFKLEPTKEEVPIPIDIISLKKITPEEIATMQIYRVEWVDLKPVKKYLTIPFGDDSHQEIDAIMGLISQAPKVKPDNCGELNDPDRALVIRLVKGSVFEILYSSHLSAPFASVKSRKLKEALYGLSCRSNNLAIFKVKGDKSVDVTHIRSQSVQRSGTSSNGIVAVALKLTSKGDLVLNLKIRDSSRKEILVDEGKKIGYGKAITFNTLKGKDMFIAYLLEPPLF
jgi:hypothetical protein